MRRTLLLSGFALAAGTLAGVLAPAQDDGADLASTQQRVPALDSSPAPVTCGPYLVGCASRLRATGGGTSVLVPPEAPQASVDVPPPAEDRWRTYDVPFLPEGGGWVVAFERVAADGIERHITDPITPETLHLEIADWLGPARGPYGLSREACRVEERRRIHVELDPQQHDVLARVMAAARWSVVDLGAYLAARELRAMLDAPAAEERAWARVALRDAAREIDDAAVVIEQQAAWRGRPAAAPPEGAARAEERLLLTARAFLAPPNFLRDVGFEWRCKGSSLASGPLDPLPARSRLVFVDDTQVSIMVRASEKSRSIRDVVVHEHAIQAGQDVVVDLGACGRLTVRAVPTANRKFLQVQVAARCIEGAGMRFHAHMRCVVPDGGTALLRTADAYLIDPEACPSACILLTLQLPSDEGEVPAPASTSSTDGGP